MPPRWHPSVSRADWLNRALAFIAAAEGEALARAGEFRIVLAGGETPRQVYRALAMQQHQWSRWQVWFGDERCLPPGHPERNDTMARSALLDPVALGRVHPHVHPIPGERGAVAAARDYAGQLAGVGAFDLVLLGLGEDGHTASLFPGVSGDADAIAVLDAPKPPPERVSLSARRLSHSRQVLFLAGGAGKREAVERWRAGVPIPAAAIRPEAGVDVLLDPDLSLTGVI